MAAVDPRVLCPLDPAHEVLKSRLQFHLVRCMKNHDLRHKAVCPYNAVHIVDKINFADHVVNCPDSREVQAFLYKTDAKTLSGILTINEINHIQSQERVSRDEENWDDFVGTATYDPMKNSEGRPIVRTLIGAPPAKRRQFRMQERRRMELLDELPKPVASVKEPMKPLRVPRRLSIPSIEEEEEKQPLPLRPPRNLRPSSTH